MVMDDDACRRKMAEYAGVIEEKADHVFEVMAPRCTPGEMAKLHEAFQLAYEAHSHQFRRSGEPYILHPIAVATIAAEELWLDAAPVIAAFLHDVVEDTDYTNDDIRERFGDDVAFLVRVVTKSKKERHGQESKQVANYRQMLNSVQYDIRALLVKLADRLHNMRTLSSMRPDKQMKIAGETDYFYAPLANRLGLYNVKTELETSASASVVRMNSRRWRCSSPATKRRKKNASPPSAVRSNRHSPWPESMSMFISNIADLIPSGERCVNMATISTI